MTFQELVERRTHLKKMLLMAKALPETAPGRAGAIAELETKILLIKLHLNCVY